MFVLIAAVSLSFMAVLCHGASFTPCPVLDAHMQDPFANSPCSGVGVAVRALCYCLGVGEASTLSAASARDCVLAASSSNVTCPIVTTCLRGYVRSVTALTGSRVNQSDDCRTFGSKMHVAQMTSHHVTASCASMMCGILNATDLSLRCSISSASTVCLSADIDRDALDLRGVSLVGNVTFFVMHPTLTSSFSNDDYGAGFAAAVTSDLTNVIPGLRAPALTLLTLHFTRLYAFVSFAMVDPLLNLTATLEAVQALQSRNWRPPVLARFLSPPRNSVLSTVASAAYPPAHQCEACGPTALRSAFCACLSSNRTSLSACISAVVGSRVAAKVCAATLAQLPPQQVSSWCGCGLRRRLNLTQVLKSPAGNQTRTSKHHCNTARDAQHCGSTKGCFWDAVGSLCRKAVTTQPTHSARGNSVAPDISNVVRVTCAALVVASVIGVALHPASRQRKVTDPQLKPIVNPQRKLDVSL